MKDQTQKATTGEAGRRYRIYPQGPVEVPRGNISVFPTPHPLEGTPTELTQQCPQCYRWFKAAASGLTWHQKTRCAADRRSRKIRVLVVENRLAAAEPLQVESGQVVDGVRP